VLVKDPIVSFLTLGVEMSVLFLEVDGMFFLDKSGLIPDLDVAVELSYLAD